MAKFDNWQFPNLFTSIDIQVYFYNRFPHHKIWRPPSLLLAETRSIGSTCGNQLSTETSTDRNLPFNTYLRLFPWQLRNKWIVGLWSDITMRLFFLTSKWCSGTWTSPHMVTGSQAFIQYGCGSLGTKNTWLFLHFLRCHVTKGKREKKTERCELVDIRRKFQTEHSPTKADHWFGFTNH